MREARQESVQLPHPADAAFQAALGVVQNTKNHSILAVHNGGRKLVVRERAKMSNPKFYLVKVTDQPQGAELNVAVGSDPRSPKALLDGRANDKALKRYLENVQGALNGTAPVTTTPVPDHYVQKKDQVPWTDPNQEPQIELGGNFLAMYAW